MGSLTPLLAGWTPLLDDADTPLRWPAEALPLPLAAADASWDAAAAGWTRDTPAAFAPAPAAELAVDGQVAVADIDDPQAWDEQVGDAALVGFTVLTHADGLLLDADVVLNTARFRIGADGARDAYDRQTVLSHELGHVLGLGHSCGPPFGPGCAALPVDDPRAAAVMASPLPLGERRGPTADDVAGLRATLPEREVEGLSVRRVVPVATGRWRVEGAALAETTLRAWAGEAAVDATWVTADVVGASPTADRLAIWHPSGAGRVVSLPPAPADGGIPSAPDLGPQPSEPAPGCAVHAPGEAPGWAASLLLAAIPLIRKVRR